MTTILGKRLADAATGGMILANALAGMAAIGAILYMISAMGGRISVQVVAVVAAWSGGPYLGHCLLAAWHRRHPVAAALTLLGTVASAMTATEVYRAAWQPMIRAGTSEGFMNCNGPIVELGVPILQWGFVALLAIVTGLGRLLQGGRGGR